MEAKKKEIKKPTLFMAVLPLIFMRIPTTDLPAEHRAGIPYGTEINFAFRPDLIHLFDPETEKNLMY